MEVAYGGEEVRVQNVAPCWNGRVGNVLRWIHDDWYIVEVDGVDLVLDLSRDEFVRVEGV